MCSSVPVTITPPTTTTATDGVSEPSASTGGTTFMQLFIHWRLDWGKSQRDVSVFRRFVSQSVSVQWTGNCCCHLSWIFWGATPPCCAPTSSPWVKPPLFISHRHWNATWSWITRLTRDEKEQRWLQGRGSSNMNRTRTTGPHIRKWAGLQIGAGILFISRLYHHLNDFLLRRIMLQQRH